MCCRGYWDSDAEYEEAEDRRRELAEERAARKAAQAARKEAAKRKKELAAKALPKKPKVTSTIDPLIAEIKQRKEQKVLV